MNVILLIVYGVAMWFVGALSYRWMIDKFAPDLSIEISKRILLHEEGESDP